MDIDSSFDSYLDLRGIPCPVNFVRCRLALEDLSQGKNLKVELDKGEPEETVILGLQNEGYQVKIVSQNFNSITFLASCEES